MIDTLRAAYSGKMLTDAQDMAPYLIDWRKTWHGTALAVALPDNVAAVSDIVRWCAANNVAIVPQGGNTGQSGGSVPRDHGDNLVLSLTRLNKVRAIDPVNNTITVDAGCILQTVQQTANAADRYFPLSLGAEGSCTIGGNLAANAGGTAVLRYGNCRDLCLGLEVVTAEGGVWDGLKGLRKDNSGYDLRDLFIASEGTLGIITGAVMKLFPKPAGRATALVAVGTPADAMTLFDRFRQNNDTSLTAFELMSDFCLKLVVEHIPGTRLPSFGESPWYVLVELSDHRSEERARAALEQTLSDAFDATLVSDALVAESLAQARSFWTLRESISEAQGIAGRPVKHDIALPLSSIAKFVEQALQAISDRFPDVRPGVFGHLGDGNLHFNIVLPKDIDEAKLARRQTRLNAIVHDLVRVHGGTISAEHGLGVLRRDEADAHRSPIERMLMARIKSALDPQGIMNPEKLLGRAC